MTFRSTGCKAVLKNNNKKNEKNIIHWPDSGIDRVARKIGLDLQVSLFP